MRLPFINLCVICIHGNHAACVSTLVLIWFSFLGIDSGEYQRLKSTLLAQQSHHEFYTKDEIFREHWKAIQVKETVINKALLDRGTEAFPPFASLS